MKKLGLMAMAALWAAGCAAPMSAVVTPLELTQPVSSAYPLSGRVEFAQRSVLATTGQIADKATVSLIDMASNQTVTTTLTDAAGNFNLVFQGGFTPNPATTYVLEAVKGLGANAPGNKAVRLRTIVRFNSGWTSLKNAVPGPIVVSAHTTAMAIAAAVRTAAGNPVALTTLIGALDAGNNYPAPVTNLSVADFSDARTLVNLLVAADEDPVARIGLEGGATWVRTQDLLVMGLSQPSDLAGRSIKIMGTGFSGVAGENTVTFNGVAAAVTAAAQNQLTVTVPVATNGPVVVVVNGRVAASQPAFTYSSARLNAWQSDVAPGAGDLVTLEGVFGGSAMVRLPGGIQVPARGQGPNRASFRLPFDVRPGGLSVETNGVETDKLPFDVTSYKPNLTPGGFALRYPQASAARQETRMANKHRYASAAVVGDWVYLFGGLDDGGSTQSLVERAAINADGTLGHFNSGGLAPLPAARANHSTAVIGRHVYLVGGGIDQVAHATIDGNGELSAFSSAGEPTLALSGRQNATVAVVGNWLYVLGGHVAGTATMSIERAPINADGTLGSFSTAGLPSLSLARSSHVSAVIGNWLYNFGGRVSGFPSVTVERASIDGSGNLGAFSNTNCPNLGAARQSATLAVVGNQVCLFGGIGNGPADLQPTDIATLDQAGNLGAFSAPADKQLTVARGEHAGVLARGQYHLLGGSVPGADRVSLAGGSNLGNFQVDPTSTVTSDNFGFRTVAIGKYVYCVGGGSNVARATVNADGMLGAFSTAGQPSLTSSRIGPSLAVIGNWLYVVGGSGPGVATIERAPINADGSLGTFDNTGLPALTNGRHHHTSAVIGNVFYVFSGYTGANAYTTIVQRSTIDAGGNLGAFSPGPYNTNINRFGPTCAVIKNRVYVVGSDTTNPSVEWAPVDGNGDITAAFTTEAILTLSRYNHSSVIAGDYLYLFGGQNGDGSNTPLASAERAQILPNGTLNAFSTIQALSTDRRDNGCVRVGDRIYVLGGYTTSVDVTPIVTP